MSPREIPKFTLHTLRISSDMLVGQKLVKCIWTCWKLYFYNKYGLLKYGLHLLCPQLKFETHFSWIKTKYILHLFLCWVVGWLCTNLNKLEIYSSHIKRDWWPSWCVCVLFLYFLHDKSFYVVPWRLSLKTL